MNIPYCILRRKLKFLLRTSLRNMSTLETLRFDNLALRKLPIDPETRNYVRTVNGACFSKIPPTPVENPRTVCYSRTAMQLLDLPVSELERADFAEYFSGNKLLPGSETAAHCYCGHQFGNFAGQLGDGAAIYLGEVINSKNERWEIQLKGAGLTPYSRSADGRKVLRSSIREFLCSEAIHFLGIPTTRAGACVTSDSEVIRDVFYDGNPKKEKCTIVLRIAPTFIRFGSFEIFKTFDACAGRPGPSVGRTDILHALLDYVIDTFYPEIQCENNIDKYAAFFKEVILRTARLVAKWQSVGFCHGVLNTDNMSIIGLTIDYGPFGFLDIYDPHHICNATDDGGRYSFIKQPEICFWNLCKLAEALQQALPLSVSTHLLNLYNDEFGSHYMSNMRTKLGLIALEIEEDKELIQELLDTMESTAADFTNTFCCLSLVDASDIDTLEKSFEVMKHNILEQCYPLDIQIQAFKPDADSAHVQALLRLVKDNPELIENLGRAALPLKRLTVRMEKVKELEEMSAEAKIKQDQELWSRWLEKYRLRILKEMESARPDLHDYNTKRVDAMKKSNPRFILRNYIAQNAILKAEQGDYTEVKRVLSLLENPYDENHSALSVQGLDVSLKQEDESQPSTSTTCNIQKEKDDIYDRPPDWAFSLKVT